MGAKASRGRHPAAILAPAGAALLLALAAGCGDDAPTDTGLHGVALRGPMTPVCGEGIVCEAAFAAGFTATRNGRAVRRFRSDEAGRFRVGLEPGPYRVVPDADAPLLSPASQGQDVVVADTGFTLDTLTFDTGIR